jgi:23S rRNA pseudouridine955/2504/2580 synthase/23S rRNA pseudouridine1911/1915/1917 synthase
MRRQIRFVIPAERAGGALLDFLTTRFTYHTRDEWLDRLTEGRMTCNGRPTPPEHLLQTGDELAYDPGGLAEPPMDDRIGVVHADADLLVIDKTGNLTCHPCGRYFNHTLWAILKTRHGIENPIFVNRIDRETSGLVLVARTPSAAKNLRAQFAGRTVDKQYLALVEGAFPERATAAGWIVADFTGEVLKQRRFLPVTTAAGHWVTAPASAVPPGPEAQWGWTEFALLERHGDLSLISAAPHTGRLHQIRVTLQTLGYPLVGDKLYGLDPGFFLRFCQDALTAGDFARMRMKRQALHAAGLRFRHPATGQELSFALPLPADMQAVLGGSGARQFCMG